MEPQETPTIIREADPDGRVVEHGRTSDLLDRLLRNKILNDDLYSAGRRWQLDWHRAALSGMKLSHLEWSPRSLEIASPTERQWESRRSIALAIFAMGGGASVMTSAAWNILGDGMSIQEFIRHTSWNGRRIDWGTAQGILISTLTVLVEHYKGR